MTIATFSPTLRVSSANPGLSTSQIDGNFSGLATELNAVTTLLNTQTTYTTLAALQTAKTAGTLAVGTYYLLNASCNLTITYANSILSGQGYYTTYTLLTTDMATGNLPNGIYYAQDNALAYTWNGTYIVPAGGRANRHLITANTGITATDNGQLLFHAGTDVTARTITIPANTSANIPIGTSIEIVNDTGAGVLSIAITTDTLVLSPAGTTGTRTLAASGRATLVKVDTNKWFISGTGLT